MTTDLIAVVTGSSRGAGKGIAIAVGQTDATLPRSMLPKSACRCRVRHDRRGIG